MEQFEFKRLNKEVIKMRTREEILNDPNSSYSKLILEVILDIRDQNEKLIDLAEVI